MEYIQPKLTIDGVDYSYLLKGKRIKAGESFTVYVAKDYNTNLNLQSNVAPETALPITSDFNNQNEVYNLITEMIKANVISLKQNWTLSFEYDTQCETESLNSGWELFYSLFTLMNENNPILDISLVIDSQAAKDSTYAVQSTIETQQNRAFPYYTFQLDGTYNKGNVSLSYSVDAQTMTCIIENVDKNKSTTKVFNLNIYREDINRNVVYVGDSLTLSGSILSGFTPTAYATTNTIPTSETNNIEVTCSVVLNSLKSYQDVWTSSIGNYKVGINTAGKIGTYWNASWIVGSTIYAINTKIWVKTIWNGSTVVTYGLVDDGYTLETLPDLNEWTQEVSKSDTNNRFSSYLLHIAHNASTTSEYVDGSMDLADFQIKVDEEEVFRGYTVKDNFMDKIYVGKRYQTNLPVVNVTSITGTPTIQKGNVSNISTTNWISLGAVDLGSGDWEILIPFTPSSNGSTSISIMGNNADGPTGGGFCMRTNGNNTIYFWSTSNKSSWNITSQHDTGITLFQGTKTYLKFGRTEQEYWFKYSIDGGHHYINGTSFTNATALAAFVDLRIGIMAANYPMQGIFHLNEAYIKIGDNITWKGVKTDTEELEDRITVSGAYTRTNHVLSNAATANYGTLPSVFNPGDKPWEAQIKYTPTNVGTTQYYFGCFNTSGDEGVLFGTVSSKARMWLSGNGTSWNIKTDLAGTTTLVVNTPYWFRIGWDTEQYYIKISTDGTTFTDDVILASTVPIHSCTMHIGRAWNGSPCLGTLDLNHTWINIDGKRWWSGVRKLYTDIPNFSNDTMSFPDVDSLASENAKSKYLIKP